LSGSALAQNWVRFNDVGGSVKALAVGSTTLYIGGSFKDVGGVSATNIAEYNGRSWISLGSPNAQVWALSSAAALPPSGGEISSPRDGGARTLAAPALVYAAGDFDSIGGAPVSQVAQWNGTAWSQVGPGLSGGVYCLVSETEGLYAGGVFADSNGLHYFALWNGSAWTYPGGGTNATVWAIANVGAFYCVGGDFTSAGNSTANHVAIWSSRGGWKSLGNGDSNGVDGEVRAVAFYNGLIYVGGSFSHAGGGLASNIAVWNDSSWAPVGSGTNGEVLTLAVFNSELYAAGSFTAAGGVAANNVAIWNGSSWSSAGAGLQGNAVNSLLPFSGNLIAGGDFTGSGALLDSSLAEWTLSSNVASISLVTIKDQDANLSTINDQSVKPWGISLYQGSLIPSNLIASSSGSFSVAVNRAGIYISAEADSGDGWIRLNNNGSLIDTLSVQVPGAVRDTFFNSQPVVTLSVDATLGWNLISLPWAPANGSISTIYPDITSKIFAYAPGSGYTTPDTLMPGKGYWIKLGNGGEYQIVGLPPTDSSVSVAAGWNMVGPVPGPLSAAAVADSSDGNVLTSFFRFSASGYVGADSLFPGVGYWVKMAHAGSLPLSGSSTARRKRGISPSR
jgi:hypothetical protein